jgi:hypothetical protein
MRDANGVEEGIQALIFATPINLHDKNLSIKHSFHKALKFFKEFKNFIFMM